MVKTMAFCFARKKDPMRGRMALLLLLCGLLAMLQLRGGVAAAPEESLIWIDLSAMRLTLYQDGREAGAWPIASGASDTPTPLGVFRVTHRFHAENSGFGACFLGLDVPWGQYGIHGTNLPGSIGSRASHGCVRMYNRDVEALCRLAPNGTRVVIEEGPYGELGWSLQPLTPGSRSAQVRAAQRRLRALGYYRGALDGIYGAGMSAALAQWKADAGLPPGDWVDAQTWRAMGVLLFE